MHDLDLESFLNHPLLSDDIIERDEFSSFNDYRIAGLIFLIAGLVSIIRDASEETVEHL